MTKLNWKLVLVHLEIVLILMHDSCTVCVERAIGSKIVWMQPMELLGDMGLVESHFFSFGDSVSVGARQGTFCAKRTIGSEIALDAPDGTPR